MKRSVLLVTDHVPGYDVGFQKSGHGHYLKTFIDHFNNREFDLTLVVLHPKIDFLSIATDTLKYRIVGPGFCEARGRVRLRFAKDIVRSIAWRIFSLMPQRVQNFASNLRLLKRRVSGYSHELGRAVSADDRAFVRETAKRIAPDMIVYDGIFNACGQLGEAQHWIITHEVKYERAQSFADRGVKVIPADFDSDVEREILEDVGNVIAIQWDDARAFARLAPKARVVVVPVSMDVPTAVETTRRPVIGRCVFVGSGSFHNYDGIRWFLDRCWSVVRAENPAATLEIFGTVCCRLGDVPAGVRLCGVVPDVSDAYRHAAVAIVPLRIGSGLKVKIVEALAYGLPVVTTSVGAQGLAEIEPRPFLMEDDARAFALACADLLRSDEKQSEFRALALACAARFTTSNAFEDFVEASSGTVAV